MRVPISYAALALRLLAAATTLGLGACMEVVSSENSEAGQHDRHAYFQLNAELLADTNPGTFHWLIQAEVVPGLDHGLLRQTGDTLLVDGHWLRAQARHYDGSYSWTAEIPLTLTQVSERPVTVGPPNVAGLPTPEPISFVGIGPASLDTIRWMPGSDVTIDLDLPEIFPDPRGAFVGWVVQVFAGDSLRLWIEGAGPPPPGVLLPGNLMPDTTTIRATLQYSVGFRGLSLARIYEVYPSIHGRLEWTLVPMAQGAVAR
ncbi:MAG: hypothetical protein PVI01_02355 [Gemmatimonadales bacterium]|jgi:hypothetical protein